MPTTVSEVSVSTNVNFTKEIAGVDVRVMYTFQGDTPPSSLNMNANYQGQGGVTAHLNLYVNPDGSYSPSGEAGFTPFNSAFYTALKAFAVKVFENYKNPSAL